MRDQPKTQPTPPKSAPVDDADTSVAGEEDPGAADDLVVDAPQIPGTTSRPGGEAAETPGGRVSIAPKHTT